ncbi:hypothetical protein TNCV_3203071 [Trichonephila clavipes]|nr:hypothetical protein TNCV_3203071 [Trichonephila clavipes]
MNGLIEIGIDQDVSWSTNEWIRWIGRDGLDSWVVVPIDVTEEVNCNFSDTLSDDFPTYLSNSGNPTRECPEKRLQRLENEHLQRSIQASIISKEEFEKKKKSFTSFPELVECLNAEKLQGHMDGHL